MLTSLLPLGVSSGLNAFRAMAVTVIAIGVLMLLVGCKSPGMALYQSTIAGRAATKAAIPLAATKSVNPAALRAVYVAGNATHDALVGWNVARLAGDKTGLASAASAAEGALSSLEKSLADMSLSHAMSADTLAAGNAAVRKLQLSRVISTQAPAAGGKKALSPAAIAAILQIATVELPVLVDWINSALSSHDVTDAQIQTELDGFAADLATLHGLLPDAPPATAPN